LHQLELEIPGIEVTSKPGAKKGRITSEKFDEKNNIYLTVIDDPINLKKRTSLQERLQKMMIRTHT
jgi:hypothetical protein